MSIKLILGLIFAIGAFCTQFDLHKGLEKCFFEEVPVDTLISGKFWPVNLNRDHQRIEFYVVDPHLKRIYERYDIENSKAAKFKFTTSVPGEHKFCFRNIPESDIPSHFSRRIAFVLQVGEAALDFGKIAKTDKLRPIEVELRRSQEITRDIHNTAIYMRHREARMRNTSESTNARVPFFTIFTILVSVGVAFFQMNYLTRFFSRKKIM
eukprot:TRINITY_DN2276_c0_g1_i1.p1 TRINITY_DN2276_c0_g1~~TRINITY_DN2276_c0_g1_i1.p1  ORF type:complete len:218 (+),score=57.18 TRINITY_DN2276_c0_g1_i1:29-655(+)